MNSILVIRPGALGDTILSVPLLRTIQTTFSKARITFLGTGAYSEILPPGIHFARFDSSHWIWLFNEKIDRTTIPNLSHDLAYVILKHPHCVGEHLLQAGVRSVMLASSTPPVGVHLVAHLHQALGFPIPPREACLSHLSSSERQKILWVHPGSGGPRKCLPLELLLPIVEKVQKETGFRLCVSFGEDDAFLEKSPAWRHLVQLPGVEIMAKRSLSELSIALRQAVLFVGNDSGIAHFAAGLGVRSAVFFIVTDPVSWAPWVPREQLRVFDLRNRNLGYVSPDEVIPDLLELVGECGSRSGG